MAEASRTQVYDVDTEKLYNTIVDYETYPKFVAGVDSVKINKNYVSFHLMPVYVFPKLRQNLSPELRQRMQGKSCFNFKTVDAALCKELAELTGEGYLQYKNADFLKTRESPSI